MVDFVWFWVFAWCSVWFVLNMRWWLVLLAVMLLGCVGAGFVLLGWVLVVFNGFLSCVE